jgi:uncharacterized membrane protein
MNQKTFYTIRIVFAMVIAVVCSIAVVQGNYVLPIIVGVTAALVLFSMKKQVTGVLADERDYKIAGKAARWSLGVYAIVAAIVSMVLMARRVDNPGCESIALVLAYSACALLIVQSLVFKYLQSRE